MTCTTGYISGSRLTAELTPIKTDLTQAVSINSTQSQQITALQAAVTAGAASTVPATGVLAGTLQPTVVLNSTTNFGTGAAATDTALGVVSLAVAANYPSASNVEAVTPAYLTVMNAAIKAGNVGTHPFVTAPTSAPSLADPATVKTNTNGEVFMWNGTAWVLIANGLISKIVSGLITADTYGAVKVGLTLTAPREGYVEFTHVLDSITQLIGVPRELVAYSYNSIEALNQSTDAFTYLDGGFMSYKFTALVAAGQVVSFGNFSNGIVQGSSLPTGNVAGYSYYNRLTTQYVS